MQHRVVVALFAAGLCALTACRGRTTTSPESVVFQVPADIQTTADFSRARNALGVMAPGDPQRAALQARLAAFLSDHVASSLEAGDEEEALDGLQHLSSLWTPGELRTSGPDPKVAAVGRQTYEMAGSRGEESPALLALGLWEHFAEGEDRDAARQHWDHLENWIEKGRNFARQPGEAPSVQEALEETTAVFPSPWLTERLAGAYLSAYKDARRIASAGASFSGPDPRIEFTGYLLARAYLRADDPHAALAALEKVELDEATGALHEIIVAAAEAKGDAQPLVDLAAYFEPEPDDPLPPLIIRQSWGIVDGLARRALAIEPNEPYANLARARVLRMHGLAAAATVHYERSLAADQGPHLAWQELAQVYQVELQLLVENDLDGALQRLDRIEAFHRRAAQLWRDRPVAPGLPDAYTTVAAALFDAGNPEQASELLVRSVELEPRPEALDLLGTIALRERRFAQSRERFRAMLDLPYESNAERLEWQVRARRRLAEIEVELGEPEESTRHLKGALRNLNTILAAGTGRDFERSGYLSERAGVLLWLGETELALSDFRDAASSAPDRPIVYAEPLLFMVTHAYLEESKEVFERAIVQPDLDSGLRLYFALWMLDLSQRVDGSVNVAAREYLEKYDGPAWHRNLADHALGKKDLAQLMSEASNVGERAEANFYEGLRLWRSDKRAEGLALMEKVVASQMMGFFEYEMAQHYLAWKELPRAARAPVESAGKRSAERASRP